MLIYKFGRLKMLENYVGDHFRNASQAIRAINATRGDKPFMRGLALCSCGPTGRVTSSVTLLKKMVELSARSYLLSLFY